MTRTHDSAATKTVTTNRHAILAMLLAVVIAFAGVVMTGTAASADERTCRGTIGATTVDNLRVPQGATCKLFGTRVKGTIKVERNAVLQANDVHVVGNVQGENARRVNVTNTSYVGGSVQIVQGYAANITGNRIIGDILFDDQRGPLKANRNNVGGNIQAFQNTGGVQFYGNRVDGNLQCKSNNPAPIGGNNIVQGSKEDQCRRL